MANIMYLLQLFHYLMFIGKYTGLRRFYYDNVRQKFRMFYMSDRSKESYFSWFMQIIVFFCALFYIYLRIRLEIHNYLLNKLENGVCHKADFAVGCLDCGTTLLMLLCFIYFSRNQKCFMDAANDFLSIHSIVLSLGKDAFKCCKSLMILTYILATQIIGKYILWLLLQYKITDSYLRYLSFIKFLRFGVELLHDLHFLLLMLCFVLLTSYYRHFNDILLFKNRSNKNYLKCLKKISLLLTKLQTVQHIVVSYFRLQFILRSFLLLQVFRLYIGSFRYDDAALHPFVGADDDDESSADMYHEPRIARYRVILSISLHFVFHVIDLTSTLIAAHALRSEKFELQQNLLDLVNFPEYFRKMQSTTGHVSENEDPNAIVECNMSTHSTQSYILDFLFESDVKICKLKSDAEVFLLQILQFGVPLKQFTAAFKLIVYGAFVLLIFDAMQQSEIAKLEQLIATGQID